MLVLTTQSRGQLAAGGITRKVVQSNGDGMDTFNTQLKLPKNEKLVSVHLKGVDRSIATRVNINPVKTASGYNLTASIDADGNLGHTDFELVAKTDSGKLYMQKGSLDVVGVRFPKSRVTQTSRATAITANVVGGQLSDCRVGVRGTDAFIKDSDVTVAGNTLLIQPQSGAGRGKGTARIVVDCPTIGVDGEGSETSVEVTPSATLADQLGGTGGSNSYQQYVPPKF